ncbi:hypothetical protein [Actinotalea solisilvae]|uniref:hypothetical protein n=1 Tax=Actinotalea solisilvae TaxID=2072922 RepID=UPI0018F24A86|nr:hypothetical protein [Actinotalea solisilvae]
MAQRTGGGGRWLLAGVAVTLVVVLVWGIQGGSCASGIDAGADCASAPVVGVAGAWVLTVGGGLFVLYALRRGFRALRRQPSA